MAIVAQALRRGAPNRGQVEALAIALGRRRRTGKDAKGKEPSYESKVFPELRPITIPDHSTGLNRYTARSILDDLEAQDIVRHQEDLERHEGRRRHGANPDEEAWGTKTPNDEGDGGG